MTGKTHTTVALCSIVPFINPGNVIFLPLVYLGAKFPDYDYKFGITHRGFTHSILSLSIFTFITSLFSPVGSFYFFIGYISHLILDSLTRSRIELFYPCHKRIGIGIFSTNSKEDYLIRYLFMMGAAYILAGKLGIY